MALGGYLCHIEGSLLQPGIILSGYKVGKKISFGHDGERELYEASSPDGNIAVIVAYNLEERACFRSVNDMRVMPYLINEVLLYSKLKGNVFPRLFDYGMGSINDVRLAWMIREYKTGVTLGEYVESKRKLNLKEAKSIFLQLVKGVEEIQKKTQSGGLFNLCPRNIIVNTPKGAESEVYIVGTSFTITEEPQRPAYHNASTDGRFIDPSINYCSAYGKTSDIYSLGMLMLYMILGDQRKAYRRSNVDDYYSSYRELWETSLIDPMCYHDWIWKMADKHITGNLKTVLQLATSLDSSMRPQSAAILCQMLT